MKESPRFRVPKLVLALAGLSTCARPLPIHGERTGTPSELREIALVQSRAHDWVRELSDWVGPRLAGSPGDAKAVAWATAKMQTFGFANVRAEKVTVVHWERGIEKGEVTSPGRQRLALTALGGSIPTPEQGIEAEIVELGSLEEADTVPSERLQGKIAFFNKAIERTKSGVSYGRVVPIRRSGASRAAKRGAVGMLMRSLSTSDNRLPHTGSLEYDAEAPKTPAAALSVPDAQLLHRLLGSREPVRVRFTLGCRSLPDAESANVVGEIAGREKPEEVVLLGAHLDSWDLATGALDDGAGVGVVLEVGRLLAGLEPRPRRTIRLILYANEEHGLSGAKAYASAHQPELERHVAALEMDHGTGKVYGLLYLGGPQAPELINQLAVPLRPLGVSAPTSAKRGGADLTPLQERGIPVIQLQQDGTYYFDIHHSADDTFDKVDPLAMQQVVAAAAVIVYGLADAPNDMGRVPEDQRKPPP